MDFQNLFGGLQQTLGTGLPSVLGALVILLIGWFVALLLGAAARRLGAALNLNDRVQRLAGQSLDLERISGKLVFWLVFVLAIIASLNVLQLETVSAPLALMVGQVLNALPNLLYAAVLVVVGLVLATVVRNLVTVALSKTTLDERLSAEADVSNMGQNIGQIAYWLVLLVFLPMVLGVLGLNGLLVPVQGMIESVLAFVPHLFAATLIAVVGYILAKILRGLTSNIVAQTNVQAAAQRAGMSADTNLPKLAGSLVFLLILIPTVIAALDRLGIEAISQPAVQMLSQLTAALPNIFGAVLILGVTWFVARFVASVVEGLLNSTGVNGLPAKLGMPEAFGQKTVAQVIGGLLVFFAMLFAVVAAANRLDMAEVSDLIAMFIAFGADILLGAIILAIGFWLAKTVGDTVERSRDSKWLGTLVRVLIMGLVIAMGLRAMGIADSIVNLAFGLTLGAVAVAFALAFGLGGRDAADRLLKKWLDQAEQGTTAEPTKSLTAVDDNKPSSPL